MELEICFRVFCVALWLSYMRLLIFPAVPWRDFLSFVTNPDPDLELTRDLPAPVLYWQPTQLPSYFRVHLELVMTQPDLYLLTLFLWILFSG